MKKIAAFAALALATPGLAQDQPPSFTFRDFTAGSSLTPAALKGCKQKGTEERQCVLGFVPVGGAQSFVMATTYKGLLSSVLISSAQRNWSEIRRAFIGKYGQPCEQDVQDWQSAGGLKVSNIVETWCFSTGKLELRQYGGKVTETFAAYTDANRAPAPSPTIDF